MLAGLWYCHFYGPTLGFLFGKYLSFLTFLKASKQRHGSGVVSLLIGFNKELKANSWARKYEGGTSREKRVNRGDESRRESRDLEGSRLGLEQCREVKRLPWVLDLLVERGWDGGVDIQHEAFVSSCDELEVLGNSEQRLGHLRRWR